MKSSMGFSRPAALLLATLVVGSAGPARADLSLVFVAGPNVNLGNITVGQSFELDILAEGQTQGEHIQQVVNGRVTYSQNLAVPSTSGGPNASANLTTDPVLYILDVKAVSAGAATINVSFNGNGEYITTNRSTYQPVSNTLSFTVNPATVATPEPGTLLMAASAAPVGLGLWWRRRRRAAV